MNALIREQIINAKPTVRLCDDHIEEIRARMLKGCGLDIVDASDLIHEVERARAEVKKLHGRVRKASRTVPGSGDWVFDRVGPRGPVFHRMRRHRRA